jgi:hypothetical protein
VLGASTTFSPRAEVELRVDARSGEATSRDSGTEDSRECASVRSKPMLDADERVVDVCVFTLTVVCTTEKLPATGASRAAAPTNDACWAALVATLVVNTGLLWLVKAANAVRTVRDAESSRSRAASTLRIDPVATDSVPRCSGALTGASDVERGCVVVVRHGVQRLPTSSDPQLLTTSPDVQSAAGGKALAGLEDAFL